MNDHVTSNVRIIQLAAAGALLYGLDEQGDLYEWDRVTRRWIYLGQQVSK